MEIMERFGGATGLRINVQKCSVIPIRCNDLDLEQILAPFAGERGQFPMTYLGLPLMVGRLRLIHLQPMQDKTRSRLAGWQGKLLNISGRKELIKSVLSALPVYLHIAMRVPKSFITEMERIMRRFLWAGTEDLRGGKCKVQWTKMARPVKYGGLGIRNMQLFSRALRLRWLWYEWNVPAKAWLGSELPVDELDRTLFMAATKVSVRNGKKAKFWTSSWLNGAAPASLFPDLFKHSCRKGRTVAEALTDGKWIQDIAHDLSHDILHQYFQL